MVKIVFLLAGLVIGTTFGVLVQQPRTQPSRAFADRCRRQRDFVEAMAPADKARFWSTVHGNRELEAKWRVIWACARLEFDKTP